VYVYIIEFVGTCVSVLVLVTDLSKSVIHVHKNKKPMIEMVDLSINKYKPYVYFL
jgi:hypothetical protein